MLPSRLAQRHLLNVVRPSLVRSVPLLVTPQRRPYQTESVADGQAILAAQRKLRPNSPHMTIYQPQITWYLSILHRMTGGVISGGVYVFGASYLIAPYLGWHLDVASMAAAFGSLPVAAKLGIKSFIAFPFAFHSINGLRHLTWDTGAALKNKEVNATGWGVVGLSAVATLGLIMM